MVGLCLTRAHVRRKVAWVSQGPLSGVLVGTRLFCFCDSDLPLIATQQKQLIYHYLLIVSVENKNYCFLKLLFSFFLKSATLTLVSLNMLMMAP
jgi:hypothetical protein